MGSQQEKNCYFWRRNRVWVPAAAGFVGQERGCGHGSLSPVALRCEVDVPCGWEDALTHSSHPPNLPGSLCLRDISLSFCSSVSLPHCSGRAILSRCKAPASSVLEICTIGGFPTSLYPMQGLRSRGARRRMQAWSRSPGLCPAPSPSLLCVPSREALPERDLHRLRKSKALSTLNASAPRPARGSFQAALPLAEPAALGRVMATLPGTFPTVCSHSRVCQGKELG